MGCGQEGTKKTSKKGLVLNSGTVVNEKLLKDFCETFVSCTNSNPNILKLTVV